MFQCEESGISLIQRTSLEEETKKEQRLAESIVNISYDEQRVDLNILQRAQQRHTYGLKSSLKLPLSYQVRRAKIFEVKSLPQETGPIFCSALLRRTLLLFSVELSFIGNPDWISVIGGKWATRPTSSDALLYFPLLWYYCLSVCDHARVLYMVKGLMILFTYMYTCLIKAVVDWEKPMGPDI